MPAQRWARPDWIIVFSLTLLAIVLRLYQLGITPIGFHFDEAYNGIDAFLVLRGSRPRFLPANLGREPLYTYWQALVATVGGLSPYTLRLSSAIVGILSIPATYLLLRRLLQQQSRTIAAITSATLCVSLWHIHFSHYGIRVIMMPLLLSGVFGFFWLGVHGERVRVRFIGYCLSGIFAGLSVWTHPTGRLIPVVLILYVLWLMGSATGPHRRSRILPLGGLILTGIVAFLVFLPLGLEYYHHPDYFWGHISDVSIFNEAVRNGTAIQALLANLGRVFGMFSWQGDGGWTHNLSGRPVFDPLLGIFFYAGLIWWGIRLSRRNDPDRSALMLLGLWATTMLWASILSDDAPDFSRTLPTLPALFVAVGLGLGQLVVWTKTKPLWSISAVLLVLSISGGIAVRDYFIVFPQRAPEYYRLYNTHQHDAIAYLVQQSDDHQVYFSQLWAAHPTARFYRWFYGTKSIDIKSIDTSDTVVLPPAGLGALYGFPPEQHERAVQLSALWSRGAVEEVSDRFGNPLLSIVRVDAAFANELSTEGEILFMPIVDLPNVGPDHAQIMRMESGLTIDGAEPSITTCLFDVSAHFVDAPVLEAVRTNGQGTVFTLFWRAETYTERDLTTFLHVFDEEGKRIAQVDKRPGNGSYPTDVWSPGERVIERYYVHYTDPPVPNSELHLQIGWYELAEDGRRRPRADEESDVVIIGPVWIDAQS